MGSYYLTLSRHPQETAKPDAPHHQHLTNIASSLDSHCDPDQRKSHLRGA